MQETLETDRQSFQVVFAFELIYLYTLTALKTSQLFFYLRIFPPGTGMIRRWVKATLAVVVAWTIVYTFVFTFLCTPIDQQWSL